jgi:hypothetical protein
MTLSWDIWDLAATPSMTNRPHKKVNKAGKYSSKDLNKKISIAFKWK